MALSEWELYRKLHRGNPGDWQFYQRVVSGADRVVELGCGWGRITEKLRAPGRTLVGLEPDAAFRDEASQLEGIEVVSGDMRNFTLPWVFQTVVIPYNAIYCLGGEDGLRDCFTRVRHHLEPGGELWLDCYPIDDFHDALESGEVPPEDEEEPVLSFLTEEGRVSVYERTQLFPDCQRLDVTYQAVTDSGHPIVTHRIRHDYLLLEQILRTADAAGFEAAVLSGGFDGRPLDDDPVQIVAGFVKQR